MLFRSFDTALGVGSEGRYQSGEETDFILRALAAGFAGIYDPSITINHPSPSEIPGRMSSRLARGYGRGMGHVLWLHDEPPLRSCWRVVRPILGAVVAILRADFALASFRAFSGVGRAEGRWRRKSKSEVACRKLRRESSSLNSDVSIAGSTEKRDAP